MVAKGHGWELREGKWQDVLSDVETCDVICTDPPYSERTHAGQRHGRRLNDTSRGSSASWVTTKALDYIALESYELPCWPTGWACIFSDDSQILEWKAVAESQGRTTFATLPCVLRGMNVRIGGDGPSNWAVYLNVSRPKSLRTWGTLPGAYVGSPGRGPDRAKLIPGAKPLWLMRAIIRDYSRPGDLIVDPYAGSGTTLLAAVIEGRRAIGAELDPKTFELAANRLRSGFTPDMFRGEGKRMKQEDLI